jgi:ABC-type branched-subunit amino acid transport system ATPase component
MLLEVYGLRSGYGKLTILHEVALNADEGEIVMILGPNGAGKTTLLKTIAGHLTPTTGQITLSGVRIDGHGPSAVAAVGVGYVPQEHNVFGELTVLDNLRIGILENPSAVESALERFPLLRERSKQRAETLSGGERQILAISAALVPEPRLLLLDEPTSGLAPLFVEQIVDWISGEAARGTGVLWVVEQNPEPILRVSSRTYLMEGGQVVQELKSSSLLEPGRLERLLLAGQAGAAVVSNPPQVTRGREPE